MSTGDQFDALRMEVASLRRRVHALTAVAAVALGVAAVALIARAQPAAGRWGVPGPHPEGSQYEAQEYRLMDPDGRLRGLWRCPPAGPSFELLDETGRVAVEVRQDPGGGTVRVVGGERREAVLRP